MSICVTKSGLLKNTPRAFSLTEVLAVVVLLSLLMGAAVPFFGWVRDKADDDNAVNRALLLNSAKAQYVLENGAPAHTIFNVKSNADKYLTLKTYLSFASDTLPGYVPTGYTYSLRRLSQKTAVTLTSSGRSLSY